MEEKKLELFIDYLIKFGFLTGISINEFVTNYNKQNTKNSFSKIKNENNFINEIYFRDKVINCLSEYVASMSNDKIKLMSLSIFSKFKESKEMNILTKLIAVKEIYHMKKLQLIFSKFKNTNHTINYTSMDQNNPSCPKKQSRNKSTNKKDKFKGKKQQLSFQKGSKPAKNVIRNNSLQNMSSNHNKKILETSQYLKEQEELAECTFHPSINRSKQIQRSESDVHNRLYTEHMKMQERKNMKVLEREHYLSKDNTFKPKLVSISPKSLHYDFTERIKSFNEKKNETIERIKSEIESDYKENCSFSPDISISQRVSKKKNNSSKYRSGPSSGNKSLSNSFCGNTQNPMPAYERLYKYNLVQKQNYIQKQKEIEQEIKLAASPSLRNIISSNINNNEKIVNIKYGVDYKKIEELYNDYKKEKNKLNKKREDLDAEQGITFKPSSYTNGKYYSKINPNFFERERQFVEEKEKFVTGYNMLMDQYLDKQKMGYGKYTNKEKEEIANNIIQRLYVKGLEKYTSRKGQNVFFQRVPADTNENNINTNINEDENRKNNYTNANHQSTINNNSFHTYSVSQLPVQYDNHK